MKKSNRDGTFGAPKPLPGQAGYRVTETEILEKQTKDMESRLQNIQERYAQQQLDGDSTANPGGSGKWKSSRVEKGSIRAYGKEVTEKFKKRIVSDTLTGTISVEGPSSGKVSATSFHASNTTSTILSSKTQPLSDVDNVPPPPTIKFPQSAAVSSGGKPVSDWTVEDVSDWLSSQKLDQYISVLADNQITGSVLLDLTLEDLDYLNINILGHRKAILRGINDLKKSATPVGGSLSAAALQRPLSAASRTMMSSQEMGEAVEPKKGKPVHWSQIEPISSKPVKGGSLAVNAADSNPNDILDEEAERLAFMEAVAEWRKGGDSTKVTIVRENQPYGSNKSSAATNSNSTSKPEDDGSMWKNPFADIPAKPAPKSTLLMGNLDEEQEHAEFVKAVEAWRTGRLTSSSASTKPSNQQKTAASSSSVAAKEGAGVGVGVGSPTRLPSRGGASSAGDLLDNITKQMEREQKEIEERIAKQKQEAEKKLYMANLELERLRKSKESTESKMTATPSKSQSHFVDDFAESKVMDRELYTYTNKSPTNYRATSNTGSHGQSFRGQQSKVELNDSDEEQREQYRKEAHQSNQTRPNTVKIALVDSILGSPGHGPGPASSSRFVSEYEDEMSPSSYCVVEVDDSD